MINKVASNRKKSSHKIKNNLFCTNHTRREKGEVRRQRRWFRTFFVESKSFSFEFSQSEECQRPPKNVNELNNFSYVLNDMDKAAEFFS